MGRCISTSNDGRGYLSSDYMRPVIERQEREDAKAERAQVAAFDWKKNEAEAYARNGE